MALLQLRGIWKSFESSSVVTDVLKDLNFSIEAGEIVSVLGPSGCGKSTFLKIAGLLEAPSKGEVLFDGVSCSNLSDKGLTALRRKHLGFVYQHHCLLPDFTATENLVIPQTLAGKARKEAVNTALAALRSFGLEEKAGSFPNKLSGGQQQRIAILRALINKPQLLLADEPTGNLDEENANNVLELLMALAQKNKLAVIIVTHNLEIAAKSDRIVKMENGGISNA